MKNRIWLYPLITVFILIVSCNKEKDIVLIAPINFNPTITYGIMTDQDGNTYKTVTIGTQVWMAENLKTTKYNGNASIPNITDDAAWINLTTPGYCWYNNDSSTYKAVYGALYNWYAVNTGKLCPTGWHVPSNEEWITLRTYLGGEDFAGGKLKETGTTHWQTPDAGATNESGFTALPGGERTCSRIGNEGKFSGQGTDCSWWSATRFNSTDPPVIWCYWIHTDNSRLWRNEIWGANGENVRCIKD